MIEPSKNSWIMKLTSSVVCYMCSEKVPLLAVQTRLCLHVNVLLYIDNYYMIVDIVSLLCGLLLGLIILLSEGLPMLQSFREPLDVLSPCVSRSSAALCLCSSFAIGRQTQPVAPCWWRLLGWRWRRVGAAAVGGAVRIVHVDRSVAGGGCWTVGAALAGRCPGWLRTRRSPLATCRAEFLQILVHPSICRAILRPISSFFFPFLSRYRY